MRREVVYEPPGPVAQAYLRDRAFVSGIRGPIGSGKSTASVMKLIRNCEKQRRHTDGRRHRRTAIIRNTFPELKTTTIKTWHQWIPPTVGSWVGQGPPTHRIVTKEIDWEVMFIALDQPKDVAKLLSLELSDAWVNEAREVPKAIIDGLTGRVGRFPPVRDGGCTDPQILMDTNAPDEDHWWYRAAEEDTPDEWSFHAQPSGRSAGAENLANLPERYYERAMAGKSQEWIKVYVDGEYGFVNDGKVVYPEFVDSMHVREFTIDRRGGLYLGLDFGLTPAAVIGQRLASGRWVIDREVTSDRMGAIRFAGELKRVLSEHYPEWRVHGITGDPAGNQGQAGDEEERTIFDIMAAHGVSAVPAITNDFSVRREAVAKLLNTLVDGTPALLIHPRCRMLRKGMAGKYMFQRLQVSGDERYQDKPLKNEYSHPCEALQYAVLGGGEGRAVVSSRPEKAKKLVYPKLGIA